MHARRTEYAAWAEHAAWMREALAEAALALEAGEVPVGAVVVRGNQMIARAHNAREASADPTAHAEMLAIRRAAATLGAWRLAGCSLYVTLEPCPMCAGAIVYSRLDAVFYGAADTRAGCCGSLYRLTEDPAFAHDVPAHGGLLAAPCEALLTRFFAAKRPNAKGGPTSCEL
ncbi:MAG: tRNA adenosine(34) deaminase TadA [Oscillospiraceae bacterium]|jgi:tRNA(adenine34) deaminase|nr:tRNA adenosine(34) deaminase TadA [Oscillospiraceae bacterium]